MPVAPAAASLDSLAGTIASQAMRLGAVRACAAEVERSLLAGKGYDLSRAGWARDTWSLPPALRPCSTAEARQLARMLCDLPRVRSRWAQGLFRSGYCDAVLRSSREFRAPTAYAVALVAALRSPPPSAAIWLAISGHLVGPTWADVAVVAEQAGAAGLPGNLGETDTVRGFLGTVRRWRDFVAGDMQVVWAGTALEKDLLSAKSLRGIRRRVVREVIARVRTGGPTPDAMPAALSWPAEGGGTPPGLVAIALEYAGACLRLCERDRWEHSEPIAVHVRDMVGRTRQRGFDAWLDRICQRPPVVPAHGHHSPAGRDLT